MEKNIQTFKEFTESLREEQNIIDMGGSEKPKEEMNVIQLPGTGNAEARMKVLDDKGLAVYYEPSPDGGFVPRIMNLKGMKVDDSIGRSFSTRVAALLAAIEHAEEL